MHFRYLKQHFFDPTSLVQDRFLVCTSPDLCLRPLSKQMIQSVCANFRQLPTLTLSNHELCLQWCMPVPAQWSDAAKASVRSAALRSGIISEPGSMKLTLCLEPEAAAIHAKGTTSVDIQSGDIFMVVDAGGGTVDVTVHQVYAYINYINLNLSTPIQSKQSLKFTRCWR